jgi:predicted DNA-binding ribbon-helix-helix protein
MMKSPVVKRSIVIAGHKTSVSLEDAFWKGLKEIATARDMTLSDLVAAIDSERQHGNLSSAIRLFVLDFYRAQLSGAKEAHNRTHEITAHATRCLFLITRTILKSPRDGRHLGFRRPAETTAMPRDLLRGWACRTRTQKCRRKLSL